MKIELTNFVIESTKEISYMPTIIFTLENDTKEILDFFELKKLSSKRMIMIFSDREKYKEHILQFVPEFKEWMCADTYDGNINLLEISEARKSKTHEDMEMGDFIKCILHEFVHSCQQELNPDSYEVAWYWEALATNLSGQNNDVVDLTNCDFEQLKTNFNNVRGNYNYAYTLGKYMIENYSKDILIDYAKNPENLRKDANFIFESARQSKINQNCLHKNI